MVGNDYAPDRGDVVWMSLDPGVGHEQSGHRPALVLSPLNYNRRVGLAMACPITGRAKGYPFEVSLPEGLPVSGVVLADHLRSIDWAARRAEFVCKMPSSTVLEVGRKLRPLLGL